MKQEERDFLINKNKLDNEYQKNLSFLQIFVTIIAMGVISLVVYFYGEEKMVTILNVIAIGVILSFIFIIYFFVNLSSIERRTQTLKKTGKFIEEEDVRTKLSKYWRRKYSNKK